MYRATHFAAIMWIGTLCLPAAGAQGGVHSTLMCLVSARLSCAKMQHMSCLVVLCCAAD